MSRLDCVHQDMTLNGTNKDFSDELFFFLKYILGSLDKLAFESCNLNKKCFICLNFGQIFDKIL